MSESVAIKRCPIHPTQSQPCLLCGPAGPSVAKTVDRAMSNSLTYAFLEGRIKELEADKHRLQEHNSDLVLRRQSAEDKLNEVLSKIEVERRAFADSLKNEHDVMLKLQSNIDNQNDHIRLLRDEMEMWKSRAEYKDPKDAEV